MAETFPWGVVPTRKRPNSTRPILSEVQYEQVASSFHSANRVLRS